MTLSATQGSAVALLRGIRTLLVARVPAILAELETAYDLTLPAPASVYFGTVPDVSGGFPSIGIHIESSAMEVATSPCYRVAHTIALTVGLAEGYVAAAEPSAMEEATKAYVEAVSRALAKWATSDLGALAVWRSEIIDIVASDSPYVVEIPDAGQWTVRLALGRVMIHQEIAKEET